MKKYKYTQLLEISLGLALEKIERLENSKPPLIPDKDPEVRCWNENGYTSGFRINYGSSGEVTGSIPCSESNVTNYKKSEFPEGLNLTPKGFTAGPLEVVVSSHTPSGIQWHPAPGEKGVALEELRELEKQTNWERLAKGLDEAKARTSQWNDQDKPRAVRELEKSDIEAIRKMESQAPKGELVSSLLDYEPKTTFPIKRPHQPETVEWCKKILENFPKPGAMITLLKDKLGVTRDQLAKLLNVGKGTITDWSKNPEQYYNPYKLENLTKLYDEHFPREQPEDSGPMTPERLAAFRALKPEDNIFEETLIPFVKGEEDIILQKPLKENPVVSPASAKRPPRLLNHNDQVTRLQLSQRALNALERAHIVTVGDLIGYTEGALKKLKGLGCKSFKEVVNATLKAGFRFTRLH